MSLEIAITLSTLVLVLGFLVFSRITPEVILLGGVSLLLLLGILDASDFVSGFSNQSVIIIGALFAIVTGLQRTGSVGFLLERLLGKPKGLLRTQLKLFLPVSFISAFINNTPIVAVIVPVLQSWSKKYGASVSRILLPLNFAAILGGMCSIVGTATNLVVNELLISETGHPGLGFFEIAWVGVPIVFFGTIYLLFASRYLLSDRASAIEQLQDPREYTVEMLAEDGGPIIGKTVEQAGLRHLSGMFLIEIDRAGTTIAPVMPTTEIQEGDRLIFAGIIESVVELQKIRGLVPATDQIFRLDRERGSRRLYEAVVSFTSPFLGRTIRQSKFRSNYNAVIVAVARNGGRIRKKIGDIALHPGDTLLLETTGGFFHRYRNRNDFALISPIEGPAVPRHDRAGFALVIVVGMVLVWSLGFLSPLKTVLLALGLMIFSRCTTPRAIYEGMNWPILLTIAASISLGKAVEVSGSAEFIASQAISLVSDSPVAVLSMVFFLTMALTSVVSNIAAAVLMFPIVISTAATLGVDQLPFIVTLMIAASCGFATPIGYQTNLMVYGPGGYRFKDYLVFGGPLSILVGLITVFLVPKIWPF